MRSVLALLLVTVAACQGNKAPPPAAGSGSAPVAKKAPEAKSQVPMGDKIELPALLLVDGASVTSDADALAKVTVTAEVIGDLRGPKIVIQKFKNKTGYKKRQGHRQDLTRVKITGIK